MGESDFRLAVFASGNGSNFLAIADAIDSGQIKAELSCLVSDQENSRVVELARERMIPVIDFSPKNFSDKRSLELWLINKLDELNTNFVALAGYMRIVGSDLLERFPSKIVNIHPSLLPAFPGKDAIGQALQSGIGVTGVTVHYVDKGIDTGPIIAQQSVEIDPGCELEELTRMIHSVEHSLYPRVLAEIVQENI